MFTIENAQLVLKDKNGNVARLQNLGPDDIVKINNAIADIGSAYLAGSENKNNKGVV